MQFFLPLLFSVYPHLARGTGKIWNHDCERLQILPPNNERLPCRLFSKWKMKNTFNKKLLQNIPDNMKRFLPFLKDEWSRKVFSKILWIFSFIFSREKIYIVYICCAECGGNIESFILRIWIHILARNLRAFAKG